MRAAVCTVRHCAFWWVMKGALPGTWQQAKERAAFAFSVSNRGRFICRVPVLRCRWSPPLTEQNTLMLCPLFPLLLASVLSLECTPYRFVYVTVELWLACFPPSFLPPRQKAWVLAFSAFPFCVLRLHSFCCLFPQSSAAMWLQLEEKDPPCSCVTWTSWALCFCDKMGLT